MKNIHVVTALSRLNLVHTLIEHYARLDVVWHPVMFIDESVKVDRIIYELDWIQPHVMHQTFEPNVSKNGYMKKNAFIKDFPIINNDYYCILDDDDMVEKETIDKIRYMDEDVIFISMKRGHQVPAGLPEIRRYPISTLEAKVENVGLGRIGQQQYFVKGKIFKKLCFDVNDHCADGQMAIWLKEHYEIEYQPQLYALFNYFEEGRWNKNNIGGN